MPNNYDEYLEKLEQLDQPWFFKLAIIGGLVIFILAFLMYWYGNYTKPQQVFWGAISNNLATTGVTEHSALKQKTAAFDQYVQINLGANNVLHSKLTVEQNIGTATYTKLQTETLDTPTVEYSRYTGINITTSKKVDFSPVLNRWSQQAVTPAAQSAFTHALYDIVPFALLNSSQRQTVVNGMKQNQVYTTDFSKVAKKQVNGKRVYEYSVAVSPVAFVSSLKQIDQFMGINQISKVDPNQYQGTAPQQVTIDIDPVSHQLVRLVSNGQPEDYSAFGVSTQLQLPKNAIKQTDLRNQLGKILAGN